ncbi:hypothetical protein DCS_06107 [Drechmeria coniospora]|uniref:Uncharacterized protein n=1 Tax=Drechmeria coniospora TaxID=98403 RepID=A0A151GAN3_DRECN|nr:hypothetical protein DCS_06107 [Drechmeria coniospora]KYK54150.1 hypothetical protein DCS_06107 [Drechmeria coniospora]
MSLRRRARACFSSVAPCAPSPPSHLNGKVAYLRVVGVHGELEHHDVAKHLAAVEAANRQQPAVVQDGAVVAPSARRPAVDLAPVPRHRHEVQQQHVVAVLDAVVAADDEQVRAHNGRRVGQPAKVDGHVDGLPHVPVDVVDPDVVEAFAPVGAAEDDELAAHHVGRVVASRPRPTVVGARRRPGGARYQLPRHLGAVADVEAPYVVERPHAVAAAEDVDAVLVEAGRVRPSLGRQPVPEHLGPAPAKVDRVEHVHVVVVRRPVAAAEDDELLAHGRARHGPQRRRHLAHHVRHRPVKGVGVEHVQAVEARLGVAAAKDVHVGADERRRVRAQLRLRRARDRGPRPVHARGRRRLDVRPILGRGECRQGRVRASRRLADFARRLARRPRCSQGAAVGHGRADAGLDRLLTTTAALAIVRTLDGADRRLRSLERLRPGHGGSARHRWDVRRRLRALADGQVRRIPPPLVHLYAPAGQVTGRVAPRQRPGHVGGIVRAVRVVRAVGALRLVVEEDRVFLARGQRSVPCVLLRRHG